MAKRFSDTEKWNRPWFRKLPPRFKCLWEYIRDNCDQIGVWYVDFELASLFIGESIQPEEAVSLFEKQIQLLDPCRWLIKDFVPFQYGELKPTNNFHVSLLSKLKNLGVSEGLTSPRAGGKEKEKVKESLSLKNQDFEKFWISYPKKKSKDRALEAWIKRKFTSEQIEAVYAALERAKTSKEWAKDNGEFVPYPASWLNAGGWNDEYTPMIERRKSVAELLEEGKTK